MLAIPQSVCKDRQQGKGRDARGFWKRLKETLLLVHRARTTFEDTERTLRRPGPSAKKFKFRRSTPGCRELAERVIDLLITHAKSSGHTFKI